MKSTFGLRENNRDSLADLSSFRIVLADGKQVPLASVADIETARGWSRISRFNAIRTVTIRGDVDTRLANTAAVIAHFKEGFLANYTLKHPTVRVSFAGENAESGQNDIFHGTSDGHRSSRRFHVA